MSTVAILGAGELGAAIARRLAEREMTRRVLLVDPDEGKARGKALDILQPARLGDGRVLSVLEIALEPVDRVALDTAAQRRFAFAHEALSKSLTG